jgi:hypothetical protein
MTENKQWVINCINSCTNLEQLSVCQSLISLFRWKLAKDGSLEAEIRDVENDLMESYVSKEAMLIIL